MNATDVALVWEDRFLSTEIMPSYVAVLANADAKRAFHAHANVIAIAIQI